MNSLLLFTAVAFAARSQLEIRQRSRADAHLQLTGADNSLLNLVRIHSSCVAATSGESKDEMNYCHICSQPRNPNETLCHVCREAISRLAGIRREQPDQRTGAAVPLKISVRPGAISNASGVEPRKSSSHSLIEASKRFLYRVGCMLRLWPQAETRGPSHAAQRNL